MWKELTKEAQVNFVLNLQQKRNALKRDAKKARVTKVKKEKTMLFKNPELEALFNSMPEEYRKKLL